MTGDWLRELSLAKARKFSDTAKPAPRLPHDAWPRLGHRDGRLAAGAGQGTCGQIAYPRIAPSEAIGT